MNDKHAGVAAIFLAAGLVLGLFVGSMVGIFVERRNWQDFSVAIGHGEYQLWNDGIRYVWKDAPCDDSEESQAEEPTP